VILDENQEFILKKNNFFSVEIHYMKKNKLSELINSHHVNLKLKIIKKFI
jgi:hypothetical protein